MVKAWYRDDEESDQRLPHQLDPPKPVAVEDLQKFGLLYWKLDADNFEKDGSLDKIKQERGYSYEDMLTCSREILKDDYDKTMKCFFEEHMHDNEEIRFFIGGGGYFDVRDAQDKWVRIQAEKGDLIVLPAGIYHRFCLTINDYVKIKRLFIGQPQWGKHNRPAEEQSSRINYVKKVKAGDF